MAGKILKRPIKDNVNGTDLFPLLCALLEGTDYSIFLLGAKPGISEKVVYWMKSGFPKLNIAGYQHGYFSLDQEKRIIEKIKNSGATVLLVAMGVPRQELWLQRCLSKTGAKIGIGVGGLFDFYSGRIPRAPLILRKLKVEWIWRLIQEPKRMWKRYLLGNFLFVYRVFLEKQGKSPWAVK